MDIEATVFRVKRLQNNFEVRKPALGAAHRSRRIPHAGRRASRILDHRSAGGQESALARRPGSGA